MRTDGQTNVTKLTVALRNFAKAHYLNVQIKIPNLHTKDFQYATVLTKMARDSNAPALCIARSGLL